MTRADIEAALAEAREALEDIEEERAMTLGGTGVHLNASRAVFLREQFEKESALLAERITTLEEQLRHFA